MEKFSWTVVTNSKSRLVIYRTFLPQRANLSVPMTTCLISQPAYRSILPSTLPALRSYLSAESFVVTMIQFSLEQLKILKREWSDSLRIFFLSMPSRDWIWIYVGEARMATCFEERKQQSIASYCLSMQGKFKQLYFFFTMKVLSAFQFIWTMKVLASNWLTIILLIQESADLSFGLY